MSTHTPGPWSVVASEDEDGYEVVASLNGEGQVVEVCAIAPSFCETELGTARLIAAAPDLLAAAIEAEAYVVAVARASLAAGRREAIDSVLPHLRAAIAKAAP